MQRQSSQSSHLHGGQASYTTSLKRGGSVGTPTAATANGDNGPADDDARRRRLADQSLAHALLPDLPALMHGSGDVVPEEVDPRSVATLATLIERYVASLVRAAVDGHDVFTDGEVVGGGGCLAVPPYPPSRTSNGGGGKADDDDDARDGDDAGGGNGGGDGSGAESDDDDQPIAKKRKLSKSSSGSGGSVGRGGKPTKRAKRRRVDYWDVPPGESSESDSDNTLASIDAGSDSDSDDSAPIMYRRLSSSASSASAALSYLQGYAPLDVHSAARTRGHYISAPDAMDARSFIFPICHDAALYRRVGDVRAARRSMERDLVDPTVMEVMREEGVNIGRWGAVDMFDAVLGGSTGGGGAGSTSKGKRGGVSSSKASGSGKTGEGEDGKKKATAQKNDNGDGANWVGAGLLDTDVDPSWPGLNAVSRGRLW